MEHKVISDYCILSADSQVGLSMAVRDYLKNGWEPQDGHRIVASLDPKNGDLLWIEYSQTMVYRGEV